MKATATQTKAQHTVNGVNVEELFGTIDAVKKAPVIAKFRFRAGNRWMGGGHNRTTVANFYGTQQDHERKEPFVLDADEPPLLLGRECISLYDCAKKLDLERGRAVQFKVNRIRATMAACDATPAALLRELINMRGLAGGCARAPIAELSEGDKAALKKLYDEVPLEPVA